MAGDLIEGDNAKLASVARALNDAFGASTNLPPMWFLTDEIRTPDPVATIARLPQDCGVVFRHYDHPARLELARAVVAAAHASGRPVLIGADAAMARALGAEGVHFPSGLAGGAAALRQDWPEAIITVAAHNAEELRRGEGADLAFLSPVFPTQSHPGAEHLGVDAFAKLVRATRVPVYALGGLTNANAATLLGSGAVGLAGIEGLLS